MATQDAFKNEMSEENLVDAGLAAIFGWTGPRACDIISAETLMKNGKKRLL